MTSPIGEEPNQRGEQSKKSSGDDIPPEYLGSVLRAEILPEDETHPDRLNLESLIHRFDFRRMGIIAFIVIVIGSCLVFVIGPGKPILEDFLTSLGDQHVEPTSTSTPTDLPLVLEETQVLPTSTIRPTRIPTKALPTSSLTPIPTLIPTEGDVCVEPLDISTGDVGKTMCVRGIIVGMEKREVEYIIFFSNERGTFYLVSYDLEWDKAETGDCIQVTGEIQQIANTPIMIFSWNNIPEICQ